MARMYPPMFPPSPTAQESGEEEAYRALSRLPETYHVLYEPRLRVRGVARTPDFVVVAPDIGVFVLEAKRWHDVVASDGSQVLVARADGGQRLATHPLEQARGAMFALKERLQTFPSLCHPDGKHAGRLRFPLMPGVLWLRDDDSAAVAAALKEIEPTEVIGGPTLRDPEALQAALLGIPAPFRGELDRAMAETIAEALAPEIFGLEAHELCRSELLELYQEVEVFAGPDAPADALRLLADSRQHLEHGVFTVAFFGSFNAGKTTVINALVPGLGLPTGGLPTTAAPTEIQRADTSYSRAVFHSREDIVRLNALLPETERLDPDFAEAGRTLELDSPAALAGHITDGRTAAHVQRVQIGVTTLSLRRGVKLVDLPGTDSTVVVHRLTAESWIPVADAIVFVIRASQALGEAETRILEAMALAGRAGSAARFVFFLNHIDEVQDPDLVERHVRSILGERYGLDDAICLRGCARAAHLAGSTDPADVRAGAMLQRVLGRRGAPAGGSLLTASGIPALRSAIESVIAARGGHLQLQTGVDALSRVLALLQVKAQLQTLSARADAEASKEGLQRLRAHLDSVDSRAVRTEVTSMAAAFRDRMLASIGSIVELERQAERIVLGLGPSEDEYAAAYEELGRAEEAWLRGVQMSVGQTLEALDRTLAAQVRAYELSVRGDALTISPEESAFLFSLSLSGGSTARTSALPPKWDAIDKGLLGAIATGATMGLSAGSIFPGAGNVAGALIGGILAGFGVFGTVRVRGKKKEVERTRERIASIADSVREVIESQVGHCLVRALEKVDSFDALLATLRTNLKGAQEASRRATETRIDLERHVAALDGLWSRLAAFCEEAGLEHQPAVSLPISDQTRPRDA